jgi:hypothetical protein
MRERDTRRDNTTETYCKAFRWSQSYEKQQISSENRFVFGDENAEFFVLIEANHEILTKISHSTNIKLGKGLHEDTWEKKAA